MTTAAVGAISTAKHLLAASLSNCTALRAWNGAAYSIAQLLARIYFEGLPPPAGDEFTLAERQALRPFILVYKPTEDGVSWQANASPMGVAPRGTLIAYFEQDTPAAGLSDPGEADRLFDNLIGRTVASSDGADVTLTTLRSQAGFLAWTEIRTSGPHRCDPEDVPSKGDHQFYFLQIEWGAR